MEEFRKANAPPEESKSPSKSESKSVPLNVNRMAALATDIRKIISKD
jgi:hypothetical protein